jgi:hypothetical protein
MKKLHVLQFHMEPESQLSNSQGTATGPCPKPDESITQFEPYYFEVHFVLISRLRLVLQSALFPQVLSRTKLFISLTDATGPANLILHSITLTIFCEEC